jgi:pilus assembly protein Flp/PilA
MNQLLTTLWQDESGQDMAEYGLLLALIAVVVVTAVIAFRDEIINAFDSASEELQNANDASSSTS